MFESHLSGRSISTKVDGICSSAKSISSLQELIPQDSVLGPLLFIFFYRDLPGIMSSQTAMFADHADDTLICDRCEVAIDILIVCAVVVFLVTCACLLVGP